MGMRVRVLHRLLSLFAFAWLLVSVSAAAGTAGEDGDALQIQREAGSPAEESAPGHRRQSWVVPGDQLPLRTSKETPLLHGDGGGVISEINPLEELHHALKVMQDRYFEIWLGTWPSAIDWTAAVMGTHLSAALDTLSRSLRYTLPGMWETSWESQRVENEINKYFSQSVAYYFGENAFSIRTQAYDDMLWVVLGWLESIRFINGHNDRHYAPSGASKGAGADAWYGTQFEPAFAHRAHVFYELAKKGWDTTLCGGGMVWNPHLTPYKNAITNELFISASVRMYLYFPGDDNVEPFVVDGQTVTGLPPAQPHDRSYLEAAVAGYAWLKSSNMTNAQGLYVDGFHIRGWGRNGSVGTGRCDDRDETVFTYNQGVLLSGLRGLWESTGKLAYLEDAHALVRAVIAATGWQQTHAPAAPTAPADSPTWSGLGRNGILEELCDSHGTCSQNAQTFKGIFFHHLTLLCAPLPRHPLVPGKTVAATPIEAMLHRQSCREYAPWVAHNARAALATRDRHGRFGMWWGRRAEAAEEEEEAILPPAPWPPGAGGHVNGERPDGYDGRRAGPVPPIRMMGFTTADEGRPSSNDPNDRGRGRTVETQGSGLAVVRALWEFTELFRGE